MEAIAAITKGANEPFSIEKITLSEPLADEVVVDIHAVGICHTDLVFASGAMGTRFPALFGHEGAGVVARVGSSVKKVAPGDKVLITFHSCGACERCNSDEPAYCQQFALHNLACMRPDGSTAIKCEGVDVSANFFGQSSFASRAVAHERNVVKLAPDADLLTLAPLGCGIQTGAGGVMNSLKARRGSSLMVVGGGAVGLSAVMGGKICGCDKIILIEPRPERREMGLSLGATHAFDPSALDDDAAQIRALAPNGLDFAFDTSGHLGALQKTLSLMGAKGTLGLVGVPKAVDAALPFPIIPAMVSGLTVKGILEGDSIPDRFLPELIALHARGQLPFDRFVRRYRFEDINQAIDDAHSGKCIKPVLTFV